MKVFSRVSLLTFAILASGAAFAQSAPAAPDTAAAVSYITTNGPTVLGAVGAAMVIIAAVAVLWKWAKAAIFG